MAVYFVAPESRQAVQIGYARDASERLRRLQAASADRLVMLGCVEGGTSDRRALHKRFASSRLHGDWFRLTKALQGYIDEHYSAAPVPAAKARGRAKQPPKYRLHKASGKALVELNGERMYLGKHGSKESRQQYKRIVAEWKSNPLALVTARAPSIGLTMAEAMVQYLRFARGYYLKNGEPTSELYGIKSALRFVRELYETAPAVEFSPLALKAVRQKMVEAGWARKTVNQGVSKIKKMFKWLAAEEAIPAQVWHALNVVDGLRKGRTTARETKPVRPVADEIVDATLPYLPEVVADMVRFQRLVGCRPGEICLLRPVDLDRSGDVWRYVPESHKCEHHEHERVIYIGPQAQAILLRYLARDADACCFQPRDSEAKRLAARNSARKTPLSCGNTRGTNRVRHKPRRRPKDRYTGDSYGRAIERARVKAFPVPAEIATDAVAVERWKRKYHWHLNQLRHTAGTEVRAKFGVEASQHVLGHSKVDTTQLYAEKNSALAVEVAKQLG